MVRTVRSWPSHVFSFSFLCLFPLPFSFFNFEWIWVRAAERAVVLHCWWIGGLEEARMSQISFNEIIAHSMTNYEWQGFDHAANCVLL